MAKWIEGAKALLSLIPAGGPVVADRLSLLPFLNPVIASDMWLVSTLMAGAVGLGSFLLFRRTALARWRITMFGSGFVIALGSLIALILVTESGLLAPYPAAEQVVARVAYLLLFCGLAVAMGTVSSLWE